MGVVVPSGATLRIWPVFGMAIIVKGSPWFAVATRRSCWNGPLAEKTIALTEMLLRNSIRSGELISRMRPGLVNDFDLKVLSRRSHETPCSVMRMLEDALTPA